MNLSSRKITIIVCSILNLLVLLLLISNVPKISLSVFSIVLGMEIIALTINHSRKHKIKLILGLAFIIIVLNSCYLHSLIITNKTYSWHPLNTIEMNNNSISTANIWNLLTPKELNRYSDEKLYYKENSFFKGYNNKNINYKINCYQIDYETYRIVLMYTRNDDNDANYGEYINIQIKPDEVDFIGDIVASNYQLDKDLWKVRNNTCVIERNNYKFKLDSDGNTCGYIAFNIKTPVYLEQFNIHIELEQINMFGAIHREHTYHSIITDEAKSIYKK